MSLIANQLLSLARAGSATEFIRLFDKTKETDHLYEISSEIGCAAVDGNSIEILKHLNENYERPFEIFTEWLNHSVKTQKIEIFKWLAEHSIVPDDTTLTLAFATGNFELIKAVSDRAESSDTPDFKELFTHKPSLIAQVFELFNDSNIEEFIAAAAQVAREKPVALDFLKTQRTAHPEEVLKSAIQHNLNELYTDIPPELYRTTFAIFLAEGKDEAAVDLLPKLNLVNSVIVRQTFLEAAAAGCLRVMQTLKVELTPYLIVTALKDGIEHEHAALWLIEQKVVWSSEQAEEVVVTAARLRSHFKELLVPSPRMAAPMSEVLPVPDGQPVTLDKPIELPKPLTLLLVPGVTSVTLPKPRAHSTVILKAVLARPEVQALPSLQRALLEAIRHNAIEAIPLLAATSKCNFKDSTVMTLAAKTRNVWLIRELVVHGADLAIAFQTCVTRNDTDTMTQLLSQVDRKQYDWALAHATKVNNRRMLSALWDRPPT